MRPCLVNSRQRFLWFRIGFAVALILTLSGWTCDAIFRFNSCLGVTPTPQIISLSPNAVPAAADSVLLTVTGNDFVSQSQILWNGSAMPTTFVDSRHLQTMITRQTFDQFGGSSGTSVLISVNSPLTATVVGCPIPASSAGLVLVIN